MSLKPFCARWLVRFVSGAMCVWLFAVVALELKYRAPHAHTMLEIVEVRWGKVAHVVCFSELLNQPRALVTVSTLWKAADLYLQALSCSTALMQVT